MPIILYYLLTCLVAIAALFILLTPHMHDAALGLIAVILGMAMLYFLQGAAFIAVIQVVVYVGGVLLLLLSALLLPLSTSNPSYTFRWAYLMPILGLMSYLVWHWVHFTVQRLPQELPGKNPNVHLITSIGLQLLGPYAWAFEWTGFVLLIALVGAVYITSSQQNK